MKCCIVAILLAVLCLNEMSATTMSKRGMPSLPIGSEPIKRSSIRRTMIDERFPPYMSGNPYSLDSRPHNHNHFRSPHRTIQSDNSELTTSSTGELLTTIKTLFKQKIEEAAKSIAKEMLNYIHESGGGLVSFNAMSGLLYDKHKQTETPKRLSDAHMHKKLIDKVLRSFQKLVEPVDGATVSTSSTEKERPEQKPDDGQGKRISFSGAPATDTPKTLRSRAAMTLTRADDPPNWLISSILKDIWDLVKKTISNITNAVVPSTFKPENSTSNAKRQDLRTIAGMTRSGLRRNSFSKRMKRVLPSSRFSSN